MSPVDYPNLFFPCAKTVGDLARQNADGAVDRSSGGCVLPLARSLAPSFIGEIDDIAAARKLKANNLKWPSPARPPSTGWA